jgi:hypothetical protein
MQEQPTLAWAVWNFQEKIRGRAEYNSIDLDVVDEALEEIGYQPPPLGPGAVVYSSHTLNSLPDDSIVYTGDPALFDSRYTVFFRHRQQGWARVLGWASMSTSNGIVVVSLGPDRDRPEWVDAPAGDDDMNAIIEFRRKARDIGFKWKAKRRWCGELEASMEVAGVGM